MLSIHRGNAVLHVHISSEVAIPFEHIIAKWTGLPPTDYYLTQNGRPVSSSSCDLLEGIPLRVNERLVAGKGGFGSMLRAIGAQIEKTTNREACRDLSGRRLRDINEEKRLKAYLEKQQDASEDERVKIQKKIEKLLSKPKHEFEDKEYEHQRSELIVETDEALQEGLQKMAAKEVQEQIVKEGCGLPQVGKRKQANLAAVKPKKKKNDLWLGNDDLSSSSETDSDSGEESASSNEAKKTSTNVKPNEKETTLASNDSTSEDCSTTSTQSVSHTSDIIVQSV